MAEKQLTHCWYCGSDNIWRYVNSANYKCLDCGVDTKKEAESE